MLLIVIVGLVLAFCWCCFYCRIDWCSLTVDFDSFNDGINIRMEMDVQLLTIMKQLN